MQVLLLLALYWCLVYSAVPADVAWVGSSSECTPPCLESQLQQNLDSALYTGNRYIISLLPGVHTLHNIMITSPVSISSVGGSAVTILDCQHQTVQSAGLHIKGVAHLSLQGVTIKNCVGSNGPGITVENSNVFLKDVVLESNVGTGYGGGLFATGNKTSVVLDGCKVFNNSGPLGGSGVFATDGAHVQILDTYIKCNSYGYDVGCSSANSQVFFNNLHESNAQDAGVNCDSGCSVMSSSNSICNKAQTAICKATCGDGVCDFAHENCLNCRADCPRCVFNGGKLESYKCSPRNRLSPSCESTTTSQVGDIINFMEGYSSPVSGYLYGYFRVPVSGQYGFSLQGTNMGARMYINDNTILDAYYRQTTLKATGYVQLDSSRLHAVMLDFFSFAPSSRSISILWDTPSSASFEPFHGLFYSQYACFDGIVDPEEANPASILYCPADVNSSLPSVPKTPFCGDGICQERDPNTCIQDCAGSVTPVCSPLAATSGHIPAGFWTASDTLGTLIQNQILYHLPGVEHLTFGIDIVTGEERLAPLFYFDYCNNVTNIVQDMYRGLVYNIPEQLHAEPFPRCSYNAETKAYSTSSELQQEMTRASSISLDGSASGNTRLFQAEAKAAFSQSQSVKTATELETRRSGSIMHSEVLCITSKITINHEEVSFHPVFVADVAAADTVEKMKAVIYKYGTHYYKSATMGGKLTQITSMDASFDSSSTETEKTQATTLAFSASVSSPVYGAVSGSFGASSDESVSEDFMLSFEQSSSRSSVVTEGGAPGAYGPNSSPSSFGDWAKDIDLLPVPVEKTFGRIQSLIPNSWIVGATAETPAGRKVSELWEDAQLLYFTEVAKDYYAANKAYSHYTLYWFFSLNTFNEQYPLIYIKLASQKPVLVLDQGGRAGTRGPLRYDACKCYGSCSQQQCNNNNMAHSPVVFDFVAPELATSSPANLYFDGQDPTSLNLHNTFGTQKFYVLDYAKSELFAFYPQQQLNQATYDHSSVLLHFTAKLTSNNNGNFGSLGYVNVQITLTGRNGQLQVNVDTKDVWPESEDLTFPTHITLPIPKGSSKIGPITSIQMQAGIPAQVYKAIETRDGETSRMYISYQIADVWAAQTFCEDVSQGLREGGCEGGSTAGLSYVYAAPKDFKASLITITSTGNQGKPISTAAFSLRNRNSDITA